MQINFFFFFFFFCINYNTNLAPARTRTLGLTLCVGPVASSLKCLKMSNIVLIYPHIPILVRPKIWDDWTLLPGPPVLRFSIFYEFFFTKSQKKIFFFLFRLKISLYLFLVRLENKNFFASPGRFFVNFFGDFSKSFDDFFQ